MSNRNYQFLLVILKHKMLKEYCGFLQQRLAVGLDLLLELLHSHSWRFYTSLELSSLNVSSIEILKTGLPQRNSNHELFENYIYSGKTNPLIYSRTYDLKFACGFELHYFPFDHQECFILVMYF